MVKEGNPGKYKLRAVEPQSRRPLVGSYATSDQVAARRPALERAEYSVVGILAETVKMVADSTPPVPTGRAGESADGLGEAGR